MLAENKILVYLIIYSKTSLETLKELSYAVKYKNVTMLSLNLWEKSGWMKKEDSPFNNASWVCLNAIYTSFEKF